MTKSRKILLGITGSLGLLVAMAYAFDVDYLFKAVRTIYFNGYTTAFLADYPYFDNRIIEDGATQHWNISGKYNFKRPSYSLQRLHKVSGTTAFLVIRNDSILHESYYDGYHKDSLSNSFSMAKSIVSAALGRAIMDGKIKSLNQPVGDFLPQFKKGLAAQLTVGDLSSMASGLDWDENYYSPFSVTTRAYFDDDLTSTMLNLKVTEKPGQSFKYLSGNTQLLAMVIEKATGMPLPEYISKKFWIPMGAENAAFWQTDRDGGVIKAYCCIASTARDFARFGKLYMNHGKWNGVQLLDSAFIAKSVRPRFADAPEYGYGWWLADYEGKNMYYMRGHLGQYTFVIPEDNLIIVRLGHRTLKGDAGSDLPIGILKYIDGAYELMSARKSKDEEVEVPRLKNSPIFYDREITPRPYPLP